MIVQLLLSLRFIDFQSNIGLNSTHYWSSPTGFMSNHLATSKKMHSIRSDEAGVLKVPKFQHGTFGKSVFTVSGSRAWNCLPKEIRLCDEMEAFKRNLKTRLFVKFVNEFTLAIYYEDLLWNVLGCHPHSLQSYINLVKSNLNLPVNNARDQANVHLLAVFNVA